MLLSGLTISIICCRRQPSGSWIFVTKGTTDRDRPPVLGGRGEARYVERAEVVYLVQVEVYDGLLWLIRSFPEQKQDRWASHH